MTVNIQIEGVPQVKAFLSAKSKEALNRAEDAIKKAGFYIQGEVVESIAGRKAEPRSVDTGNFMKSILAIFPNKLSANIGCNKYPVAYADVLEYGTSTRKPRRHFSNTKTRNEKKVKDFVEAEIKKIG